MIYLLSAIISYILAGYFFIGSPLPSEDKVRNCVILIFIGSFLLHMYTPGKNKKTSLPFVTNEECGEQASIKRVINKPAELSAKDKYMLSCDEIYVNLSSGKLRSSSISEYIFIINHHHMGSDIHGDFYGKSYEEELYDTTLDDDFINYYEAPLIIVPSTNSDENLESFDQNEENQLEKIGYLKNNRFYFNCKNLLLELNDRSYHKDYEFDMYKLLKGYEYIFDYPKSLITDMVDDTYIVIDVETTGLVVAVDRITEIAAIKYHGGEIIDTFNTLIFPQRHQFNEVVKLTGISDDMLIGAPLIYEVLPSFIEFLGNNLLVAHNAIFDLQMLTIECCRFGIPMFTNKTFDTLAASRKCLKGKVKNHKLTTIKEYFGLVNTSHRALDDCETCSLLYQYYLSTSKQKET